MRHQTNIESMTLKKIFLGWDKDLLELAATRVLKEAKRSEFIDLSHILAIVSTSHSIKNLNQKLTELADKEGCALLPPKIVTPQYFFSNQSGMRTPPETQKLLFWIEALKKNISHCNFLFPNSSGKSESFLWFLDKAEQISQLADNLASIGLTIEEFISAYPGVLGEDFTRFDELSHIEAAYFKLLEEASFKDDNRVKIENARNPQIPANISKVVFIAVPDPISIVLESIEILSAMADVEVWINAPVELECAFDNYGRPDSAYWKEKNLHIPDFKETVTIFDSPEDLSRDFVHLLALKNTSQTNELNIDDLSIFLPDTSLEMPLRYSFLRHEIETYNPSGVKLIEYQFFRLFEAILNFITQQDYRSYAKLLKNPDFLSYVEQKTGRIDYAGIFAINDELQNKHLPLTFADMIKFVRMKSERTDNEQKEFKKEQIRILEKIIALLSEFLNKTRGNPLKILPIVHEIYDFSPQLLKENSSEAVKAIVEAVTEMETSVSTSDHLTNDDITLLLKRMMQGIILTPAQKEGMLPMRGYLELQWELSRPFTFIIGMNEGIVPSVTSCDIFLPDSVRKKIGLPSNDTRFARDAYILDSVISSHEKFPINFIVLRANQDGESLKPSRLLLQSKNQDIFYERLDYLFRGKALEFERHKEDSSDYALKYSVPIKRLENRTLSVTDFKNFLACPFRFYLSKILRYDEEIDDSMTDIEYAEFGSVCHLILKKLGDNLNDHSKQELHSMLQIELQQKSNFFSKSLPVDFSFYSLEQRTRKALEIMIDERNECRWKVYATEKRFELKVDSAKLSLWLGEEVTEDICFTIIGKIDRIDVGADGKSVRVIDYKTGKVKESPQREHYLKISAKSKDIKEYAKFNFDNEEFRWTDLQLPFYAILLSETEEFKELQLTQCAYLTLPVAVSDTGFKTWAITNEELIAARRCAAGIILDITKGNFWPPRDKITYDDYEKLLYSPNFENYISFERGAE